MDIILILILLVILFIIIEASKHLFFKTVTKMVFIIIILLIVFFVVIGSLNSENMLKTDNEFIQTGASVVEDIEEQDIFETINDKLKDLKDDIFKK
ncbi:MAG: hypothetical protein ABIH25_00005 [Candidatus Woesearchaeota archaeon]